ncbi:DUF2635 domain-containing protein [Roseomonas eburnea]|uniref:DUF2635 domain-containing protein n=1 Tax=Neoroseomonas eburnea TaxID=1346889 RepID=A0A9X9XDX6_9PROT|nr:DUF2635 domain-containing protein [Neoroseomonas eburnea]MBR0681912.1 DUF2635 domain-containing protein [Neoroseomonas eburnea]
MERVTLRVAEGRRVRLPDGKVLPHDEDLVLDRTPFVRRRIAAGDLVPPPATTPAEPATPKKKG